MADLPRDSTVAWNPVQKDSIVAAENLPKTSQCHCQLRISAIAIALERNATVLSENTAGGFSSSNFLIGAV